MLQECALTEQAVRESVCDEPDLRQESLFVRLEYDPLGTALQRLLDELCISAH